MCEAPLSLLGGVPTGETLIHSLHLKSVRKIIVVRPSENVLLGVSFLTDYGFITCNYASKANEVLVCKVLKNWDIPARHHDLNLIAWG
jgi:hypothetical protein